MMKTRMSIQAPHVQPAAKTPEQLTMMNAHAQGELTPARRQPAEEEAEPLQAAEGVRLRRGMLQGPNVLPNGNARTGLRQPALRQECRQEYAQIRTIAENLKEDPMSQESVCIFPKAKLLKAFAATACAMRMRHALHVRRTAGHARLRRPESYAETAYAKAEKTAKAAKQIVENAQSHRPSNRQEALPVLYQGALQVLEE